jgi:ATP-dependent exoDNAse (exonuclease V) alpha subunit
MKELQTVLERLKVTNIFITGGAGVGKTTLTSNLIATYETNGKKVAKLASTGMAATLLGGQTLHSFFELGIASSLEELQMSKKLSISKKLSRIIQALDLIVIDEISMVSGALLDMVRLRLLQGEFKGKVVVVGDFLQLPPIAKQGFSFAFCSQAWDLFDFEVFHLRHVHRTDDAEFIQLLHKVRFGDLNDGIINHLESFIKPIPHDLRTFTFLFGKNDSASRHNTKQLSFINEELYRFEATVELHTKNITQKEIQRYFQDARIEQLLEVKKGVPVLFTRNSWNYFNGERGIVIDVDEKHIYVQKSNQSVIKLEPVKQSKTKWVEQNIKGESTIVEEELFSIYQFPIKLAFAITIHKSQGMGIENLIIETNEIFSPSQFYVALSRATNPSKLILTQPQRSWKSLIYAHYQPKEFYNNLQNQ